MFNCSQQLGREFLVCFYTVQQNIFLFLSCLFVSELATVTRGAKLRDLRYVPFVDLDSAIAAGKLSKRACIKRPKDEL